jgi:predicted transcriptional regulator
MEHRNRMDIVAIILESATGKVGKTKMMYNAFLSYNQLREYLAALQENGLLEYEQGSRTYKITDKGIHFLQIYNHVDNLVTPSQYLKYGNI